MAKCITVQLSDGSTVRAQVGNNVDTLPKEDVEALEQFIAYVKARKAKRKIK